MKRHRSSKRMKALDYVWEQTKPIYNTGQEEDAQREEFATLFSDLINNPKLNIKEIYQVAKLAEIAYRIGKD